MNSFQRIITASFLSIALFACTAVADETIYDNTDTFLGPLSFTALQIGDEINAAGTARTITELLIGVSQQGFAGTADLQARLYANDGTEGRPGTLLWEGAVLDDVALTGEIELISFAVPGVVVPDTFTWTIQISDTQPVAVGLPHFDPPAIGGSPDYAWFGNGTTWTKLTAGGIVNFMARIIAAGGCAEDVNGDGVVDILDLLAVLAAWGGSGGPEDVNGDGVVDVLDLLAVLSAWGSCG